MFTISLILIISMVFVTFVKTSELYPDWLNVALFKPAYQSTTYVPYVANWGNDGNHNFYSKPTANCQQTYYNNPAWWMVDLRGTFVIQQIIVTNRADKFSVRLKDFQIEIFKTDPRKILAFPNVVGEICLNMSTPVSNGTYTWNCTQPLVGRYLWIIMRHKEYLHVVEVEIMASQLIKTEFSAYRKHENQVISWGPPLRNLTQMGGLVECALECSALRETETCTAFNWFPLTSECVLFKVDPRFDLPPSKLVNFYNGHYFTELY